MRKWNVNGRAIDEFTHGYLTAALWSSTDESDDSGGVPIDQNYDLGDIDPGALDKAIADCAKFQRENAADLEAAYKQYPQGHPDGGPESFGGHDFWLTRVGHGAGYWDGDLEKELGRKLTDAAKRLDSRDLYIGDDGSIHGF